MKKHVILCICLLLCLSLASPVEAAVYTLAEKMTEQIDAGSGLKGSFTLNISGSEDWLSALNGIELQLRGMQSEPGSFVYSVYQEDPADESNLKGLTQLEGQNGGIYFRSDLLPQTVLKFPTRTDFVNQLRKTEENPPLTSMLLNLMTVDADTWKKDWQPVLEKHDAAMEQWLATFASAPAVTRREDTESLMELGYVIPAASLKKGILDWIAGVIADEDLCALLRPMMTEQQQQIYLNPNLMYFYEAALDALQLTEPVTMTRTVTAFGVHLNTRIVCPLPANETGVQKVILTEEDGIQSVELDLADAEWLLILPSVTNTTESVTLSASENTGEAASAATATAVAEVTEYSGTIVKKSLTEDAGFSLDWQLRRSCTEYVDDSARNHQLIRWTLNTVPLSEGEDIHPCHAELEMHYSGKSAKSSATTLNVSLEGDCAEKSISFLGTFKTTSPWVLSFFNTGFAMPVTADQLPALLETVKTIAVPQLAEITE